MPIWRIGSLSRYPRSSGVSRLRRFLAPQLAEMIVSSGDERIFESHRREIVVLFCDLRGFTAFAETAEPEEVMAVLRDYHEALGPLVYDHEGTLMRFTGDGLMVFFNDPSLSRPRGARGAAGGRDAGGRRGAGGGLAPARPRDRLRHRHRPGLCHDGADRLQGQIDYTAMGTVTNLAPGLRCRERRADPDQPAGCGF